MRLPSLSLSSPLLFVAASLCYFGMRRQICICEETQTHTHTHTYNACECAHSFISFEMSLSISHCRLQHASPYHPRPSLLPGPCLKGAIFNLATEKKMTKRLLSTACHTDDELFLFLLPAASLGTPKRPSDPTAKRQNDPIELANPLPRSPSLSVRLLLHIYAYSMSVCVCVCVANLKRILNSGQLG